MSDSDSDLGPVAPPQPAAAKKRRVLDGEAILMEQVRKKCGILNLNSTRVSRFETHARSYSCRRVVCMNGRSCTLRPSRTLLAPPATSSSQAARCIAPLVLRFAHAHQILPCYRMESSSFGRSALKKLNSSRSSSLTLGR